MLIQLPLIQRKIEGDKELQNREEIIKHKKYDIFLKTIRYRVCNLLQQCATTISQVN